MNYKRVLILCIAALIIVSSLAVVSAGWFDFLGGGDEPLKGTLIICKQNNDNKPILEVHLQANNSYHDILSNSSGRVVYLNVTDENNHTEYYNISEWKVPSYLEGSKSFLVYEMELDYGTYQVSAYFPGDDEFNCSSFNQTIVIDPPESDSSSDYSSDPSTEVVSTETTHDGGLTITTTTYADGHTKTVTNGVVYK